MSIGVAVMLVGIVVLIALVCLLYARAGSRGDRGVEESSVGGEESQSLFGADVPVRETERRFIEVMPRALIVCDGIGSVRYASPEGSSFGLLDHGRLAAGEIRDVLAQVVGDGAVREREIAIPVRHGAGGAVLSGRGVQAGHGGPSNTLHLKVRIGEISSGVYAVFLVDMSDQRHFEAMRRDFVTNVSHELKTPAGAISLLAETITDAADDPDAVRYFAGRITTESQRLTELVHHLIDLQRAQAVGSTPGVGRMSVLDASRSAISQNAVQARAKHIDVRLTLDNKPVAPTGDGREGARPRVDDAYAMADPEAIETAVKNLVENAIRYSPENTIVAVGVARRNGRVVIRVVDQGIGIPAHALGRIFERFYRVDPARSRATGGSGLGLSIAKHCVEECGGTISVWSHESEGSTFTIELPAAPRQTEPDGHSVDGSGNVGGSGNVDGSDILDGSEGADGSEGPDGSRGDGFAAAATSENRHDPA